MDAVQLGDDPVGQLLHPVPEGVGAGDLPVQVGVQRGARGGDVGAAEQVARDGALLGLDPVQLGEAPLVGLLQIDHRTEEVARLELVLLPADRVDLAGPGCQLVGQPVGEPRERGAGATRGLIELGCDPIGAAQPAAGRGARRSSRPRPTVRSSR